MLQLSILVFVVTRRKSPVKVIPIETVEFRHVCGAQQIKLFLWNLHHYALNRTINSADKESSSSVSLGTCSTSTKKNMRVKNTVLASKSYHYDQLGGR